MADAPRDDNSVPTLLAVSNADGTTPVVLWADPTTHRLLVSSAPGDLGDLGDVTLTGEAQGDILYFDGSDWVNLAAGNSGEFLKTQGAGADPVWASATAGAAGNDTEVQFNDGGVNLGGDAGFTYNKTTNIITLTGGLIIYDASNDGNPEIRLGAADAEEFHIQAVYDSGAQTLDYVLFQTDAASATADKGEYRFNVDGTLVATIDDGGLEIKASGSLSFGAVDILTDSAGTTTLNSIDALDATTEATIEGAIDTLANLTSIQGNTFTLTGDFIRSGAHSLTLTTTGATNVTFPTSGTLLANVSEDTTPQLGGELDAQGNNVTDLGDITFQTGASGGTLRTGTSAADKFILQAYDVDGTSYTDMLELDAGNTPLMSLKHITTADFDNAGTIRTGQTAADTLLVQAYDVDGASFVTFVTLTANNDPSMQFNQGVDIASDTSFSINGTNIVVDSSGTATLSNIDALDATTEATIEAAIDTLANLTTVQGLTVTLADAGADAIFGWDDTAGAYENLTQAEVLAVIGSSSESAQGVVELATSAEIDTGTDATRAMSPDAFQASKRNIRWLIFNLVEAATDCATGTNLGGDFLSPIAGVIQQSDTTPFYLYATNSTAGTTGTMVVDININGTSIMTTNKLDFDSTEKTTTTASTPPDLTTTALAVGDIITIDVDAVHTTAAKGLTVYMAVLES